MNIKDFLKPGDVINVREQNYSGMSLFQRIEYAVAIFLIKADQRSVLGNKSEFRDHHTMQYHDPEHIFSEEPPEAKWRTLDSLINPVEVLTVYRHRIPLADTDIKCMRSIADEIINWHTPYDTALMVNMGLATLAGHPEEDVDNLTKQRPHDLVCSVAVATIFERFRVQLHPDWRRLFSVLTDSFWSRGFLRQWDGVWKLKRVMPALFANTNYFDNEFYRIGTFKNGVQIA